MKYLLLLSFLLFTELIYAQLSATGNVIPVTGTSRGYTIHANPSGDIVIGGNFNNPTDFDPGTSELILEPTGTNDGVLLKIDQEGQLIWAFTIGGEGGSTEWVNEVRCDTEGNIYVSGNFSGTCDFDPSPQTFTLYGADTDGYLAKYSPEGALLWVREISSPDANRCHGLAFTNDGNILVSGFLSMNTYIGNPDYTLDPAAEGGFVCSFDEDGNVNWVSVFQATAICNAVKLAVDGNNEIYGTGIFSGSIDCDPGSEEQILTSAGLDDAFFYKLNASGQLLWCGKVGSDQSDWGYHIAVNNAGESFLAGYAGGDFTIDQVSDSEPWLMSLQGETDAYCIKLNAQGDTEWAYNLGSAESNARTISVAADELGLPVFVGYFQNALYLTSDSAEPLLQSEGGTDAFLLKFDNPGNVANVLSVGGLAAQEFRGLYIDDSGNYYLTGLSNGDVDLDPGEGVISDTSEGTALFYLVLMDEATTGLPDHNTFLPELKNTYRINESIQAPCDAKFSIFNNSGQLIESRSTVYKGQTIANISNPGIYIVNFDMGNLTYSRRILVIGE